MISATPTRYSMVVSSKPAKVSCVCDGVLAKLQDGKFTQEDIFAVHLALEEAFVNAVKHGNKMDPKKEIKIDYIISTDKIEISLSDDGDGFDPDSVPDPTKDENLYKTEGRGLFLIRSYMDRVEFNKRGNQVSMVKYKSAE